MDQANIDQLNAWRAQGNTGDLPVGWQSGTSGGADGRSTGSIDYSQVPSVQEFTKGQFAAEDVPFQALITKMMGQEKPIDMFSRMESEAGIPELRGAARSMTKEIGSIEDVLDTIEGSVSGRTRESLVTESMRQRMVSSERQPHEKALAKLATGLGRVTGSISELASQLSQKVGLVMKGQMQELEPLKLMYSTLVDRNSRLASGFTVDRQTQLDIAFDKLARERTLSDQDWALVNSLAQEEREYTKTLRNAIAELGIQLTGNESLDQLLSMAGEGFAEQIKWDRDMEMLKAKKKGDGPGIDVGDDTPPSEPKPTSTPSGGFSPADPWAAYGLGDDKLFGNTLPWEGF